MNIEKLNNTTMQVRKWAEERNIILGSEPINQAMKLFSELGELADNVGKGRDTTDDIGDVIVVTIVMCTQHNIDITKYYDLIVTEDIGELISEDLVLSLNMALCSFANQPDDMTIVQILSILNELAVRQGKTLVECLDHAYNDIKDRKGRMENGVFIKEGDI